MIRTCDKRFAICHNMRKTDVMVINTENKKNDDFAFFVCSTVCSSDVHISQYCPYLVTRMLFGL